ncbi:MAG: cell division protein ZapA [Treponema sp.]|nr:cell division protein ZapA [Spirochaetia bacterium]MDD7581119.1 cell division protein ZapA [Treponema sp.]MCI7440764.1 cell division protein ZapA [Spirochaetia bacterium]MDY3757804.1 cell division protein ZapA [Treponema sp.]MDY4131570.1 cell division protein ZapA [Treponema sp.]
MGKLVIDVLGTSFSAQADEDDEYLEKLSSYYKEITSTIKKSTNLQDPMKISILAGITLVDELYKEKQKNFILSSNLDNSELRQAEIITQSLIEKIDGVLD